MRGIGAPRSPFVRKVRVAAIETGQPDVIQWEMKGPPPQHLDAIAPHNPLGKVPVILLGDGTALYDSAVICEYLDTLHGGVKLVPEEGAARWAVLRLQALGDGIGDAAISIADEGRRPEAHRLKGPVKHHRGKVLRALDILEADMALLSGALNLGHIAVACSLGYLDFNEPDFGWREGRAKFAAWYDDFITRPSMVATAIPTPS